MPRNNHPIEQEELMAYLDGELPVDRAGVAAGHLEHCRECQGVAADLQGVSRRVMEWQLEPVGQEIGPMLADALKRSGDRPRKRPRIAWRWALAIAGTGVAALVVISSEQLKPRYQLNQIVDSVHETRAEKHVPRKMMSYMVAQAPMIARTAELTVTTNEFDKARAGLEDILKRHNGYVGQLNVNAPTGAGRTLDATLRIPTDQRDTAIAEIKKLGRVEAESQTGEEVTAQYVDLEARLSNARNTEQRFTDILRQRTGKLSDVLEVEKELSRVREQIEQMEAEKKTLTKRVEFLTLVVRLAEDYRAQLHMAPDSILGRFRNAAIAGYRSGVDGVVAVILFLLSYGPSLVIWAAVLFFPARYAWKRLRRG